MNAFLKTAAVLFAAAAGAIGAEAPWTTDYVAAKERSKAEDKPIFISFVGSDWCGWCKKIDREILSKPVFLDYAKENLVLLEIDFPRDEKLKKAQSKELVAQNQKLDKQFEIKGYPTIYLIDAEGEKLPGTEDLAEDDSVEKGPEAFVAYLKKEIAEAKKD